MPAIEGMMRHVRAVVAIEGIPAGYGLLSRVLAQYSNHSHVKITVMLTILASVYEEGK